MRRRLIAGLAGSIITVLVFVTGAAAVPAPGFTELVSVSSAGVQGNQDSERPSVSADGRFVAFASLSDNLVPGDTNGKSDIFVRDRVTGATERVSVSSAGRQGNADGGLLNGMAGPSISADGRFVVFDSEASNLVKRDTNGTSDVFLHDRLTGTTVRVSISSTGAQASGSEGTISADGTRVAFTSFSDNLVQGDTNFSGDVFVRDLTTGTTVRVSVASDGSQGNNSSSHPSLDGDGHVVAFDSAADLAPNDGNGTVDVYVHDLDSGVTEAASIGPAGSSFVINHGSNANISSNGRFVVFDTQESNLFPDANGPVQDAVLFDRVTHTWEDESVSDTGVAGNDNSSVPVVSADGRFVAFTSRASNLVGDDTNARDDVFVGDRQAGTTARVSVGSNGQQGDLDSITGAIDADGQVVAFFSDSSTFVPETQSFFAFDIFVRDARPTADLGLTLADAPDPATTKANLTYTATIANRGPATATGVTLAADLPADSTFVSASGATCTRQGQGTSGGTLTCQAGAITAGASATVTIVVTPTKPGTLTLAAKVFADQPDPNRTDNSATETTTVTR
jgi:uncharacterized repeat protein (TIGR01451 family)